MEVTCWVPSLAKDQRVLVSVRALLWMDTLQQVVAPVGDEDVLGWHRVPLVSPWGGIVSPWCPHGAVPRPHTSQGPVESTHGDTRRGGAGAPLATDTTLPVSPCVSVCPRVCPQREHLLKQFLVQSRGFFNTSAMPYRVQPRVLPAGEAEVQLSRSGGE